MRSDVPLESLAPRRWFEILLRARLILLMASGLVFSNTLHGNAIDEPVTRTFSRDQPASERSIQADWVCEKAKSHRAVTINNAIIVGSVDFHNLEIEAEISLTDCEFQAPLNCSFATFKSPLKMDGCTFRAKVDFSDAKLRSLSIKNSQFLLDQCVVCPCCLWAGSSNATSVWCSLGHLYSFLAPDMDWLRINPPAATGPWTANFTRLQVAGPFDAQNAEFGKAVLCDFQGAHFEQHALFMNATFGGVARFRYVTFAQNADFSGASFKRDADFNGVRIALEAIFEPTGKTPLFEQKADFTGADLGSADFDNCKFGDRVSFNSAHFRYHAFFRGAVFKGLEFSHAKFEYNAEFANATFGGNVVFNSAHFSHHAIFKDASFGSRADFSHATFDRNAEFQVDTLPSCATIGPSCAMMGGTADFHNAQFQGDAHFANRMFVRDAVFRYVNFTHNAEFSGVVFNAAADFNAVRIAGEANFCSTTETQTTQPVGQAPFPAAFFKGDANFVGAEIGSACFVGCQFSASADFNSARFREHAFFGNVTFAGPAGFSHASFEGNAEFLATQFGADADFNAVRIAGSAHFRSSDSGQKSATVFKGKADFITAIIRGDADFSDCQFKKSANFDSSRFQAQATFIGTRFEQNANFENVKVEGNALFIGTVFRQMADFGAVRIDGSAVFGLSSRYIPAVFEGGATFSKAIIAGQALFEGCTFAPNKNDTSQDAASFESASMGAASFDRAFFSSATFVSSHFAGRASFAEAKFPTEGLFDYARFSEDAHFDKTIFGQSASFREAAFHVLFLPQKLEQWAGPGQDPRTFDLRGCNYTRLDGNWEGILDRQREVREKKYDRQPFTEAEDYFRSAGNWQQADDVYLMGRKAERLQKWKEGKYLRWILDYLFLKGMTRYGVFHRGFLPPLLMDLLILALLSLGAIIFYRAVGKQLKPSSGIADPPASTKLDGLRLTLRLFMPFELPWAGIWEPSEKPMKRTMSPLLLKRLWQIWVALVVLLGFLFIWFDWPGPTWLCLVLLGFAWMMLRVPRHLRHFLRWLRLRSAWHSLQWVRLRFLRRILLCFSFRPLRCSDYATLLKIAGWILIPLLIALLSGFLRHGGSPSGMEGQ